MPDGGMAEDFLHVAGLVQVSVGNGTMRPFLLVGIENTERRRDMTGSTENEEDKKIAPRVGGSAAFRRFLREELMPQVKERYRTTEETAIVGESLAGLFVVETFLLEPDLFDIYWRSIPASGGTTGSWSREPERGCGHSPRSRRRCIWRAATRKGSRRPRSASPMSSPGTRPPASAGTTRRCRRRSTPRSIIPPRSRLFARCSSRTCRGGRLNDRPHSCASARPSTASGSRRS